MKNSVNQHSVLPVSFECIDGKRFRFHQIGLMTHLKKQFSKNFFFEKSWSAKGGVGFSCFHVFTFHVPFRMYLLNLRTIFLSVACILITWFIKCAHVTFKRGNKIDGVVKKWMNTENIGCFHVSRFMFSRTISNVSFEPANHFFIRCMHFDRVVHEVWPCNIQKGKQNWQSHQKVNKHWKYRTVTTRYKKRYTTKLLVKSYNSVTTALQHRYTVQL